MASVLEAMVQEVVFKAMVQEVSGFMAYLGAETQVFPQIRQLSKVTIVNFCRCVVNVCQRRQRLPLFKVLGVSQMRLPPWLAAPGVFYTRARPYTGDGCRRK